ncbi:MAG: hypothetical protein JWQ76_1221 [Ramlibacter sp.]|nr:hypothetical protein [Ramlibacter sp.]
MAGRVLAVHRSASHSFSKYAEYAIILVPGLGVAGDAHSGATVRHRSRVARDPTAPNLRQVHLLQAELFDELVARDFAVFPGDLGENITTRGLNLLELPTGTRLRLGTAEIEITGLRNPCSQIDRFQRGLTAAVLERSPEGALVRKAGVMAIVQEGGEIRAGDAIVVHLPPLPHRPLEPV